MSEIADRYRTVAGGFTQRVEEVAADAWERPAPCEGWVARDVIRHLVSWVPPFLESGAGISLPSAPSPDDDPVAAWRTTNDALQAILDDPEQSARSFDNQHTGRFRVDEAIGRFILGDVLVHTWDLARATGLDESLDPDEVHTMLVGIEPMGDALVASGHYARAVPVPADADEQTRLIAFTGRQP